jgi:hypothetical protein
MTKHERAVFKAAMRWHRLRLVNDVSGVLAEYALHAACAAAARAEKRRKK